MTDVLAICGALRHEGGWNGRDGWIVAKCQRPSGHVGNHSLFALSDDDFRPQKASSAGQTEEK